MKHELRRRTDPSGSRFIDPNLTAETWMLRGQAHRYYGTTHGVTPDRFTTLMGWYIHGQGIKQC